MKRVQKVLSVSLVVILILSITACSANPAISSSDSPLQETSDTPSKEPHDKKDSTEILDTLELEFESAIQFMKEESAHLSEKIGDSADSFSQKKTAVTDFYESSLEKAEALYAVTVTFSVDYFKYVSEQGLDEYKRWNNSMEDYYDIWSDGMDDFYKSWNRAYEDLYDEFTDLIESSYATLEYEEYSDVYSAHSNAWTAMYSAYSDAWNKAYSSYSSVWSGFYNANDDVDAILREAAREDKKNPSSDTDADTKEETPVDSAAPNSTAGDVSSSTSNSKSEAVDGIRPEVKEAMDAYEAFYDEYIALVKQYRENPTDFTILGKYADVAAKVAEMDEKFEAWESEDLTNEELKYYLELSGRIFSKLAEVAE